MGKSHTKPSLSTKTHFYGHFHYTKYLQRSQYPNPSQFVNNRREKMTFFTESSESIAIWFGMVEEHCCLEFQTVQFRSVTQSCPLFATPWTAAHQAFLSITNSRSPPKPMSVESVMPSNNLILCPPLLLLPSIFPSISVFQMSQLFTSGGQSTGASASASVLPTNTQDWFPLGWTGWMSLQAKWLLRVLSNTTVQKHEFLGAQLSSQSNSHIYTWPLEKP